MAGLRFTTRKKEGKKGVRWLVKTPHHWDFFLERLCGSYKVQLVGLKEDLMPVLQEVWGKVGEDGTLDSSVIQDLWEEEEL